MQEQPRLLCLRHLTALAPFESRCPSKDEIPPIVHDHLVSVILFLPCHYQIVDLPSSFSFVLCSFRGRYVVWFPVVVLSVHTPNHDGLDKLSVVLVSYASLRP